MKKFLRKIFQSNLGIRFRNFSGFRVIKVNLKGLEKDFSISDTFLWRTDNNYKTIVNYSDILKQYFELDNSTIIIYIFDKKNKLLKIIENDSPKNLNKLIIEKKTLNNFEGYGTFFIFHKNKNKIDESIRNSCYVGFSKNNNLPSFVHGNLMGASLPISDDNKNKLKFGIVESSLLKNNIYKIQKSFLTYDYIELFIANPTSRNIYFKINNKKYNLSIGECIIINIRKIDIITIKSNCFLLRPIAFVYAREYIDVFHC
jgi:hypothetical protein